MHFRLPEPFWPVYQKEFKAKLMLHAALCSNADAPHRTREDELKKSEGKTSALLTPAVA